MMTHNPYFPVFPPQGLPPYEEASQLPSVTGVWESVRPVFKALPFSHSGGVGGSYPQPPFPRTQCSIDSWQTELERLSSSQQVSRADLHLFVHGSANFLESQPRENYEIFFEKGKKLYESFLTRRPLREEIRSFWISYIRFMGALTLDNKQLFKVYKKLIDDGYDRKCPIPWDITAKVIECVLDASRKNGGRFFPRNKNAHWLMKGALSGFQRSVSTWCPDSSRDTHLAQFIKRDLEISLSCRNISNSYKEWVSSQLEKISQFLDSCPERDRGPPRAIVKFQG